jgi:small subunit ribosomal protein S16
MVKIRLRRVGTKHKPIYRLVVADSQSPRDGAFVEIIGTYNPLVNPEAVTVDEKKALEWLEKGAQPTETAYRLLVKSGVMDKYKMLNSKRKFVSARQKTSQKQKRKPAKSTGEVKAA